VPGIDVSILRYPTKVTQHNRNSKKAVTAKTGNSKKGVTANNP